MDLPLYVPPREAARLLGISRASLYVLLANGQVTARKYGTRTLVSVESLRAYGETLPAWTPES
jgi:excisionase family DNA binding protein